MISSGAATGPKINAEADDDDRSPSPLRIALVSTTRVRCTSVTYAASVRKPAKAVSVVFRDACLRLPGTGPTFGIALPALTHASIGHGPSSSRHSSLVRYCRLH